MPPDERSDPEGRARPQDAFPRSALWMASAGGTLVPGSRVDEFEILGVLGEGGMGVVYRARQENTEREVALKLIRGQVLGRDARKRFEFEAQVLGRLQHPGVAQIYGAGLHGEDPYFAMELVEGEPLTAYARSERLGTRERLELVVKICAAVQHAHSKGVVHRDLKPGNILVTRDGEPKVLDFGVARATDSDVERATIRTEIGQLIGTVPYMSPEQAGGDSSAIDTRSDVYALGVITYELLAGSLPYELGGKMIHEAVRVIREQDPRSLSSVQRAFRGDVDVIVAKALEKEKERRYQTAHELADDIQRYLRDEPIVARPPSAAYQFRKFARRNRMLVGGVAAVFVALIVGLAGTLWQAARADDRAREAVLAEQSAREAENRAVGEARRASEAEARALGEAQRASEAELVARREERTASTVSQFLTSMLEGVGPSVALGRDTALLREIVDGARRDLDQALTEEPLVRARLLCVLAGVYHDLAQYGPAEELAERSVEVARAASGDQRATIARSMYELARVYESTARFTEAADEFHECRALYVEAGLEESPDAISALSGLGGVRLRQKRNSEATTIFREVLELRLKTLGNGPSEGVADTLERLALSLNRGDSSESEALIREALEMRRTVFGDVHPKVAVSLTNLATTLLEKGQLEEALTLATEGVEQHKTVYGPRHPYTASALEGLSQVYERLGRLEEAVASRRTALDIDLERFGPDARVTLDARWKLANQLELAADHAGAEEQYAAMLAWARANYAAGDSRTMAVVLLVANCRIHQGRHAEAEPLCREAYEAQRALAGSPQVASAREALVTCLLALRRFAEAEPLLLAAQAELAQSSGEPARAVAARLVELYEGWSAAEPDEDHAEQAERWRAESGAARSSRRR